MHYIWHSSGRLLARTPQAGQRAASSRPRPLIPRLWPQQLCRTPQTTDGCARSHACNGTPRIVAPGQHMHGHLICNTMHACTPARSRSACPLCVAAMHVDPDRPECNTAPVTGAELAHFCGIPGAGLCAHACAAPLQDHVDISAPPAGSTPSVNASISHPRKQHRTGSHCTLLHCARYAGHTVATPPAVCTGTLTNSKYTPAGMTRPSAGNVT